MKGCAILAGTLLLLVILYLVHESLPLLRTTGAGRLLTDSAWRPTSGQFGLWPMIAGTLTVTAGALLLATPIGLLSALFCRCYAPRPLGKLLRRILELLAGLPSVVYGFWGLVVLVPLIARIRPPGASVLAGILVVAIMVLPTIALLVDAALESVPADYSRGAAALGMTRWGALRGVILPAASSGIFTAVLLATARALGETMAALMVCGNVVRTPESLLDPVRTLTANIALEMAYAMDLHRSSLFATGLLLALIVTGLVALAEVLSPEGIDA